MNKKLCCFYINDIHLITMLLPYINERINQSTKIIPIFERDISDSYRKVIYNVQGKKDKNLFKINWKSKKINEINRLDFADSLVLICGSEKYMNKVNEIVSCRKEEKDILNCYQVIQGENSFFDILDKHDMIVNTSGERSLDEIFIK